MKKVILILVLIMSILPSVSAQESNFNIFNHQYPKYENTANLGIVGDTFLHAPQIKLAYNSNSDTFDFSNVFTYLKADIQKLDFAMFQLETTFSGYGNGDILGYSSYPYFNSPDSLLTSIKDAGFDFANTASNHCYDFSSEGLLRTITVLDDNQIAHTGTFKDSHQPYEAITINNISFALIDYTYGTNGNLIKESDLNKINTLADYTDYSQLLSDIETAKKANYDFVVVSLHAGTEYQDQASVVQKDLVNLCLKTGADIIFGSHPHVMEPIEIVAEIDGVELARNKFVIYSLGNFLCNQIDLSLFNGANTDFGTLLTLNFSKLGNDEASIEGFKLTPTYIMRQSFGNVVVPIYQDLATMSEYEFSTFNVDRISIAKNYTLDFLTSNVVGNYCSEGVQQGNGFYFQLN